MKGGGGEGGEGGVVLDAVITSQAGLKRLRNISSQNQLSGHSSDCKERERGERRGGEGERGRWKIREKEEKMSRYSEKNVSREE